jgi:gluconokinase
MSAPPMILVLTGVSGTGKTTVAEALQARLGWPFQEGDALHAPEAVEKMRQGIPLTDEDRWPWLRRVVAVIDQWRAAGTHGLITCSALKRAYRDIIIGHRHDVRLIYLYGSRDLLLARLSGRKGHYMPASLLDSQLAATEPPAPDEAALALDVSLPLQRLVDSICRLVPTPSGP